MIDFPASPTTGQIFTAAGASWRYDGTKWVAYGTGSGDSGRNLIHNSLFNIWQRPGSGVVTANGYTADRYLLQISGSTATVSLSTLSDTDRSQIGDEAAIYALQCVGVGTAGAGDYLIAAEQHLESVRRTSGKTVTLSFWAKATAGAPKLGIEFEQGFGSGGSPSATVVGIGAPLAVTLSTTWARYSVTVAMPSTSGKTLGTTAGTDYLMLRFWQSAGSTFNTQAGAIGVQSYTLQLWGVQLEIGSVATPLEKPDPQQDLAKCQRFYQSHPGYLISGYSSAGGNVYASTLLPVMMHHVPTASTANITYSNAGALSAVTVRQDSLTIQITITATGSGWGQADYNLSADL